MIPSEPAPTAEIPPAPDWLPVEAQSKYYAVCEALRASRSFCDTDAAVALRYATCWHRWMEAERKLASGEADEFDVSEGRYGRRISPSAARRTSIEASREMSRHEKVLGLDPASRKSIGLDSPAGSLEDDLARYVAEQAHRIG